jgi:hypothetical protein
MARDGGRLGVGPASARPKLPLAPTERAATAANLTAITIRPLFYPHLTLTFFQPHPFSLHRISSHTRPSSIYFNSAQGISVAHALLHLQDKLFRTLAQSSVCAIPASRILIFMDVASQSTNFYPPTSLLSIYTSRQADQVTGRLASHVGLVHEP